MAAAASCCVGLALTTAWAAAASAAQVPEAGPLSYPAAFFAQVQPNTAFDMVQRLPGFTFDGGAAVRGFGGAAGNVLIDGQRPTSKQDDLQSVLTRIPASQVERIEVIRGAAPGIDMQDRTVVANVIRRRGAGFRGVVQVSDQLVFQGRRHTPAVRLEASGQAGRHALEASLVASRHAADDVGRGEHTVADASGLTRSRIEGRGDDDQAVLTLADETPLAGGAFRLNGLLLAGRYLDRETEAALTPNASHLAFRDQVVRNRGELGAHFVRDFAGGMRLELAAMHQRQDRSERARFTQSADDQSFAADNSLSESVGRGVLRYAASPALTWEVSAEAALNRQDSRTALSIDGAAQGLPAADLRVRERRGEVAASVSWTASTRLTVEAGARIENSSLTARGDEAERTTLTYVKPRAVVAWSPRAGDQLRLRLEREVGQLDFDAFTASGALVSGGVRAGNPGLRPQDVWTWEVALEHRFWAGAAITLTWRRQEIGRAVDRIGVRDPVSGLIAFDAPGNIGRAREDDGVVDLTLPLDRLGDRGGLLKLTGTVRRTRVNDPADGARRQLSQVHPVDAEVHFSQTLAPLKATFGLDLNSSYKETYYRFDAVDDVRVGWFYTAFVEYRPRPELSLRAELSGLTAPGFRRRLALYDGQRAPGATPVAIDSRRQNHGPSLMLRARKTIG